MTVTNLAGIGVDLPAVPAGWVWVPLGEVADVRLGKMLSPKAYEDDLLQLPYLRNENVRWGWIDLGDVKRMGFKREELQRYSVEPGDLLVCEGGEAGRCAVYVGPAGIFMYQKALHRVRPIQNVLDAKYLQLFFQCHVPTGRVIPRRSETTIQHLPLEKMQALPVSVPPAIEQRRIVAEIEKHFTRLDAAVTALKRSQANLKRYRAAVLKSACEGRLVPTEAELARREGREYEPAERLLERILAERRARWEAAELTRNRIAGNAPKDNRWTAKYREPAGLNLAGLHDLPEGWCWARVEQVGEVKIGRQRSPKHHNGPHMRPYLRVANVFDDRLDLSDVMRMNFDPREFEEYRLAPGDILLNEGQSPELLGRPALFRGELTDVCFQNTLVRFRSSPQLVPEYALIVFRSYMHNGRFRRLSRQTTNIAHLGGDRFAKTEFPLPPIAEQRRIVAEAERVLSIAKKMDEASLSNVRRANAMRQAILKRAFEGKLVPEDPSDEPASALLERMRADRADQALLHRAKPTRGTDERLAHQQLPLPV